jgi:hypothetical protein
MEEGEVASSVAAADLRSKPAERQVGGGVGLPPAPQEGVSFFLS